MSSVTTPAIEPNKKYSGGVKLCPCSGVLVDCTGQPIAAVDDKTVTDSCVVGQGCTPESWDIYFKKNITIYGEYMHSTRCSNLFTCVYGDDRCCTSQSD